MRTALLAAITCLGLTACTSGKSTDDTDVDTDNPDDTDVTDTDVIDTDVEDTDVVDTDDTDVVDTDVEDTDVAVSDMTPDILSHSLYVDCMPVVPADPFRGGFEVRYQNDGAAADRAVIQTATLTLNQSPLAQATWTFGVTPAGSGSVGAGQSKDVSHAKMNGTGSGSTNDPCAYCGGIWSLDVTWEIGGASVPDSLDAGTIDCVY